MTQSNRKGEFLFRNLRPGTWTVRIIPTYWKNKFKITKDSYVIELKSQKTEEVNFELVPKVRQIKFKNNKTIKVGGRK